jgi:hypothetical protein
MKKQKISTIPLPRLNVLCVHHHLEKGADGEVRWIGQNIDVEVVSLHFSTGSMRVRSTEKIAWDDRCRSEIKVFDISSEEFFKQYKLIELR